MVKIKTSHELCTFHFLENLNSFLFISKTFFITNSSIRRRSKTNKRENWDFVHFLLLNVHVFYRFGPKAAMLVDYKEVRPVKRTGFVTDFKSSDAIERPKRIHAGSHNRRYNSRRLSFEYNEGSLVAITQLIEFCLSRSFNSLFQPSFSYSEFSNMLFSILEMVISFGNITFIACYVL